MRIEPVPTICTCGNYTRAMLQVRREWRALRTAKLFNYNYAALYSYLQLHTLQCTTHTQPLNLTLKWKILKTIKMQAAVLDDRLIPRLVSKEIFSITQLVERLCTSSWVHCIQCARNTSHCIPSYDKPSQYTCTRWPHHSIVLHCFIFSRKYSFCPSPTHMRAILIISANAHAHTGTGTGKTAHNGKYINIRLAEPSAFVVAIFRWMHRKTAFIHHLLVCWLPDKSTDSKCNCSVHAHCMRMKCAARNNHKN